MRTFFAAVVTRFLVAAFTGNDLGTAPDFVSADTKWFTQLSLFCRPWQQSNHPRRATHVAHNITTTEGSTTHRCEVLALSGME
jgi:hypothetical protein